MAGMNTLGSAEISDYQTRTVTIEVAGICQQSVLKKAATRFASPTVRCRRRCSLSTVKAVR